MKSILFIDVFIWCFAIGLFVTVMSIVLVVAAYLKANAIYIEFGIVLNANGIPKKNIFPSWAQGIQMILIMVVICT